MTARGPSCGDLDFFCWDATVERFNGWVVANPTLMGPTECSKTSLFWEDVTGQVQAYDPQIPPSKKITTCPCGHRHTESQDPMGRT